MTGELLRSVGLLVTGLAATECALFAWRVLVAPKWEWPAQRPGIAICCKTGRWVLTGPKRHADIGPGTEGGK